MWWEVKNTCFEAPKVSTNPPKPRGRQVGWNDGETIAGGFGRGRLVEVSSTFPWVYYVFFAWRGAKLAEYFVEVYQKNKASWHESFESLETSVQLMVLWMLILKWLVSLVSFLVLGKLTSWESKRYLSNATSRQEFFGLTSDQSLHNPQTLWQRESRTSDSIFFWRGGNPWCDWKSSNKLGGRSTVNEYTVHMCICVSIYIYT